MNTRGFFNGILAGGVVGAILAMYLKPNKKPISTERIVGKSKRVKVQADKMMDDMSKGVKEISKIVKK